ncbi:hypothetical protein P691DRAFT_773419 [Macrolepiota fuliginosa MF-IS2]|uniref:Uncharacterized protein n=1 Tax=Macrolepiota fuliginosa MF-IS2 TaxID=1400762 RepID=A0A9P5XIM3_9AGAR|nr:hypothetical protein P691DRAFT_773419 [Macrolepiota fuliginosa MF-IS2]
MNFVPKTDGGGLVSSRWKNTPDVYVRPETCARGGGVPSLIWFCLQCMSEFPDQVHIPLKVSYRRSLRPPPKSFRVIDDIFASAMARQSDNNDLDAQRDLSTIDPRLWVVIVQVFDQIPSELRIYTIPLNDEFLPLLQGIQNTDTFSLLTILELPSCSALEDNTLADLRFLHTLAAFDASNTRISADGVLSLARTLQANSPLEATRKLTGPWGLRVLRLKHCSRIAGSTIYESLDRFPLLSVVDLRGTKCRPPSSTPSNFGFKPNQNRALFSSDLAASLKALQHGEDIGVFSSPEHYQYILRVKSLCHISTAKALDGTERRARPFQHPSSSRNQHEEYQEALEHDSYTQDEDSLSYSNDSEIPRGDQNISDGNDWYGEESEPEGGDTEGGGLEGAVDGEGGNAERLQWNSGAQIDYDSAVWRTAHARGPQSDPGILLPPGMRPPKRQRRSTRTPERAAERKPTNSEAANSAQDISQEAHEQDESDIDNSFGYSLPSKLSTSTPKPRKLHWYDADRKRLNTYVPLNSAKGKHDHKLMLHRPVQSWIWLEKELDMLLAKEIRWEQARANKNVPVVVSVAPNKGSKIQEGLQAMTTIALQRRQLQNSQTKNDLLQVTSGNPFAKRPGITDHQLGTSTQKMLRPISSLQIPEFTREVFQQSQDKGITDPFSDTVVGGSMSQRTNNSAGTTKSLSAQVPFARLPKTGLPGGDSPGEEHLRRRGTRTPGSLPMTSNPTPSNSEKSNIVKSSKKRGKDEQPKQPSFNWAAWASKKP